MTLLRTNSTTCFFQELLKKNLFSTETDREHAIVFISELPLTSCVITSREWFTPRDYNLLFTPKFSEGGL